MKQPQPKTPFLERFQNWSATLGALLFAFFLHPFAYDGSVGFVAEFGERHYGLGWALPPIWWLVTFVGMAAAAAVVLRVVFTGGVITAIRRFT